MASDQGESPGKRIAPFQWKPGASGNPGGRPRCARSPSEALRDLNDTPGETLEQIVANFVSARRRAGGMVAADVKAVRAFQREHDLEAYSVSQMVATNERLEGKVPQTITATVEHGDVIARIAAAFGVDRDELEAAVARSSEGS